MNSVKVVLDGGRLSRLGQALAMRDGRAVMGLRVAGEAVEKLGYGGETWRRSAEPVWRDVAEMAGYESTTTLVVQGDGERPETYVFAAGKWPTFVVAGGDVTRDPASLSEAPEG